GAISSGPATSTRFSRLNPDARDGVTNITAAPPSGCGDLKFQPACVAVIDVINSTPASGIRAEYPTRSPPQSPFADGRPVASMIQSAASSSLGLATVAPRSELASTALKSPASQTSAASGIVAAPSVDQLTRRSST